MPKMDDSVVTHHKIQNQTIIKYVMRSTELAKQELIFEKEGILKMGKKPSSKETPIEVCW